MTNEELILESKIKYPVGCKVKCLYEGRFPIRSIAKHRVVYENKLPNEIWFSDGGHYNVLVYKEGVWAEIVSLPEPITPEPEIDMEEILKQANEKFPLGSKVSYIQTDGKYNNGLSQINKEHVILDGGNYGKYISNGGIIIWLRKYGFARTEEEYYDNKPEFKNKKLLKQIIEEESIENIDLQDNGFMIKFGDILNTETKTGDTYYLLDTYVFIPYTFEPNKLQLHRGVINELEAEEGTYDYSGFVHYGNDSYGGKTFCYGECGVDHLCNNIRVDGLDSDKFNMLMIKLHTYLSTSSHDSGNRTKSYRKLEKGINTGKTTFKLIAICTINGVKYPQIIKKTTTNQKVESVVYDKPYIKVLKEWPNRAFTYNGVTTIPKVVKHHLIEDNKTIEDNIRVNLTDLKETIKKQQISKIYDEINNKESITFQNLLHKFPDKLSGVDGSVYI